MDNWDLVLPPSRPSEMDLFRISSYLAPLDRTVPVAILGSTPEFRDHLFEMGFHSIVVLDRSLGFYDQVSRSRIYSNPEEFVNGDWIESLPFFRDRFGAILSDLTAGNVPYTERTQFYDDIAKALRPGGFFIDKNLVNDRPLNTIEWLIRHYSKAPHNLLTVNYFSCDAVFCSELISRNRIVDSSQIYGWLSQEMPPNPRLHRFIKDSKIITPTNCLWYYGIAWSELVTGYCAKLELREKFDLPTGQPYFGRAYQFVWQRST
jgi:SAM-dependent methyltransferase